MTPCAPTKFGLRRRTAPTFVPPNYVFLGGAAGRTPLPLLPARSQRGPVGAVQSLRLSARVPRPSVLACALASPVPPCLLSKERTGRVARTRAGRWSLTQLSVPLWPLTSPAPASAGSGLARP